MKQFFNNSFDYLSFILGMLAGILLAWILTRIRRWLPKIKEPIEKQSEVIRMGNLEGIDKYMRQVMLIKAQHKHLAHDLFPLDEIIVPPRFLISPFTNPPSDQPSTETIAGEVVPFLPDLPELTSAYPAYSITLEESIQNGANIVITGYPGTGKTVALAYFTSQLAKKDPSVRKIWNKFPLFFHIQDINLAATKVIDPLDRIAESMREDLPKVFYRRLPRFLKFMAYHGRLIILVDGLDELTDEAFEASSRFLYSLIKKYPKARLITTASPDNLDGLSIIGFYPLVVASWNRHEVDKFLRCWVSGWNNNIAQNRSGKDNQLYDPNMVIPWLTTDYPLHTPMEWTLKVWAFLAGDMRNCTTMDNLESFIQRTTLGKIPHQKIEGLAYHYLQNKLDYLSSNQVEKTLARIKISSKSAGIESEAASDDLSSEIYQFQEKRRRRHRTVVSRSAIYSLLLNSGILVENAMLRTRFLHPILTGYLASYQLSAESKPRNFILETRWSVSDQAYRFLSARDKSLSWLPELLADRDPLNRPTVTINRWVGDIPEKYPSRIHILRHIAGILQNDAVPAFIRARISSGFICSNDPSRTTLCKHLFLSKSPSVRRLAALSCGAIGDPKIKAELSNLLHDPDFSVRQAACLAMGQLDLPDVNQWLKEIILSADEDMRRAAAETLAVRGEAEHQILRELATHNDLLARRAAVFGISQIRQKWVIEILERVAVEDGQWVVRNAASQAVDALQASHPSIPMPQVKPSEAGWLIAFAARVGMGVSPNIPPISILLLALSTGSQSEKLSSLTYLRTVNQPEVITGIYQSILQEKDPLIVSAAYYSLWLMGSAGFPLESVVRSD